jgi:hypothetical protein
MTTVEQDTIYQYLDGRVLLNESLQEREQLLQGLEHLAKAHQGTNGAENVLEFPLIQAQALLFELSINSEDINRLIGEVNRYAERCGKPRVKIVERGPQ